MHARKPSTQRVPSRLLLVSALLLAGSAFAAQGVSVSGVQQGSQFPTRSRERFLPPPPELDPLGPSPTAAASVLVSGIAPGASSVRVQAPTGAQVVPTAGGPFAIDVALQTDAVNSIFVFARTASGFESAPARAVVTQDSSAPEIVIEYPLEGALITAPTVDVSGRITDVLNGAAPLLVKVDGILAQVSGGADGNRSFVAKGVPLNPPGLISRLNVAAQDFAGNEGSTSVRVGQLGIPGGSSTAMIVGGNGQVGPVKSELPQPLSVEVRRADGSPYEGKLVTFEVTRSDGRLAAVSGATQTKRRLQVLTDTSGIARAWMTLGQDAGVSNNFVEARTLGSLGTLAFEASAAVGTTPSQINADSGSTQVAEAGTLSPIPLRAWVSDGRNGIAATDITFRVLAGGGSVAGQGQTVVPSDGSGFAQVKLKLGPQAGINVVEASFGTPAVDRAYFVVQGVTRVPGGPTSLRGSVLDHSGEPLEGVAVSIYSDDILVASTDTDLLGRFRFDAIAESGVVQLEVQGGTATLVGGPGGHPVPPGRYPLAVVKTVLVQDARNILPRPIQLPPQVAANEVTLGDPSIEGAALLLEGVEGMSMIVPAGSLVDSQGLPVTTPVTYRLNQVRFDSLYLPLPKNVGTPLVWSLVLEGAPDGGPEASTFAVPISIEQPNVGGLPAGASGTFLGPRQGGDAYAATSSGETGGDGSTVRTEPGSGLTVSGDLPSMSDGSPEAVLRGQLGLGTFAPPFEASFALELPAPCSTMPGLIPPTALLPVAGGTIREDTCGSGAFGAPRGSGLNHGVDIVGNLGDGIAAVYDGTVVAVQTGCVADLSCSPASRDCGGGYGNFVVLQHSTGAPANALFYSAYAQLDAVFVSVGDPVLAGGVIGSLGQTGNANPACLGGCAITPYVHFEISAAVPPLADERPRCNPQDYLVSLPPPSGATPPAPGFAPFRSDLLFQALGGVAFPTDGTLVTLVGMPALPGGQVSLRAAWKVGDAFLRLRSVLADIVPGQTLLIGSIPIEPLRAPAELDSSVAQPHLTAAGQQTQVTVTARDAGGTPRDVTLRSDGTSYSSTNAEIVSVDQDGLVTAVGSGRAFVSATNDGLTSVVELSVELADPGTTVVGFVTRQDGTPVVGALVSVYPGGAVGTSQPAAPGLSEGWFSIPGVPSDQDNLTVFADLSQAGQEFTGAATDLVPVADGLTDAGIIAILEAVHWSSPTSGAWSDASRWSTGQVPPPGAPVVIDQPGALTVTLSSASGALMTLRCREELVLASGGDLQVDVPLLVEGSLVLQGGALRDSRLITPPGNPVTVLSGPASRLDAVILQGELELVDAGAPITLEVAGGLTLANGRIALTSGANEAALSFVEAQALAGSGEVELHSGAAQSRILTNGAALELAAGILVHGAGGLGAVTDMDVVVNRGAIAADQAGQALTVNGSGWTSSGSLTALDGAILRLAGTFTSTGLVSSVDSVVDLAGTLELSDLGTTSFSGGQVWISGTLQASDLDLRGSSADWALVGGTVSSVTLRTNPGQVVAVAPGAPSTLDAVVLAGEVELGGGAASRMLIVRNGLELQGGIVRLASSAAVNTLELAGAQTVTGAGEIVLATGGGPNHVRAPSGLVTFGPAISVRGAGTLGGPSDTFQILGRVRAGLSAGLLVVQGSGWSSAGSLEAGPGAVLRLAGSYTLAGSLTLDQGTLTTASGPLTLPSGCVLRGNGTIGTSLVNVGRVRPGGSGATGLLTVLGNYTQPAAGILEIEVAGLTPGSGHDQVVVNGTCAPQGQLDLLHLDGFLPAAGAFIDPLRYFACGGGCSFASFNQTPPGIWVESPDSRRYRLIAN